MAEQFTTMDVYIASYLSLQNFTPQFKQQGPKIIFAFDVSERLNQEISNYYTNALIEAQQLANAVKRLKGCVFDLKREWDNGKVHEKSNKVTHTS